jgi:hypothetical protein
MNWTITTPAVVAAAGLAFGAAMAQPASAPSQAQPQPAAAAVNVTTSVDADGVRHTLVASSPVPDTPENRTRYGQPMSRAGRRTPASGN